jgi:hypothetical protein
MRFRCSTKELALNRVAGVCHWNSFASEVVSNPQFKTHTSHGCTCRSPCTALLLGSRDHEGLHNGRRDSKPRKPRSYICRPFPRSTAQPQTHIAGRFQTLRRHCICIFVRARFFRRMTFLPRHKHHSTRFRHNRHSYRCMASLGNHSIPGQSRRTPCIPQTQNRLSRLHHT